MKTFCIGECPSNSVTMGLGSIIFKEWRDRRTFSNLKSTHCTLLILSIIFKEWRVMNNVDSGGVIVLFIL
jgi:hypothetical protein